MPALLVVLLWMSILHLPTAFGALPYPPEDLLSPSHLIDSAQPGPSWDALIRALQGKGAITANFTENRYLPFKKIPVVFQGELRLSPTHGLSLQYTSPETRALIVDQEGVLFRDGSGRSRELTSDPRALQATTTLLHVMRFDLGELSKSFTFYAAGDRVLWHLAFEPKDEALARNLNRIIVTGEGEQVRRIQLRKSSLQAIEILVEDVREGVTFQSEEIARFFR